jgi:hypothetical protein
MKTFKGNELLVKQLNELLSINDIALFSLSDGGFGICSTEIKINTDTLFKLCVFFETDDIDLDSVYVTSACDTCNYGEEREYTLEVRPSNSEMWRLLKEKYENIN